MFHAPEDIEVGEGGFDHDHIGAFGEVEGDFAEGFFGIGGVHLVAASVTELGGGFGGIAEGAVIGGGVFGGVGEDGGMVEAGLIEGLADGADAAVHHIAGGDDIGAGFGVADGGFGEELEGGVILDGPVGAFFFDNAAVAVAHVFAEADVGNDEEIGEFLFEEADGLLDDAIFGVGPGGFGVFGFGDAEEEDGADAVLEGGGGVVEYFVG